MHQKTKFLSLLGILFATQTHASALEQYFLDACKFVDPNLHNPEYGPYTPVDKFTREVFEAKFKKNGINFKEVIEDFEVTYKLNLPKPEENAFVRLSWFALERSLPGFKGDPGDPNYGLKGKKRRGSPESFARSPFGPPPIGKNNVDEQKPKNPSLDPSLDEKFGVKNSQKPPSVHEKFSSIADKAKNMNPNELVGFISNIGKEIKNIPSSAIAEYAQSSQAKTVWKRVETDFKKNFRPGYAEKEYKEIEALRNNCMKVGIDFDGYIERYKEFGGGSDKEALQAVREELARLEGQRKEQLNPSSLSKKDAEREISQLSYDLGLHKVDLKEYTREYIKHTGASYEKAIKAAYAQLELLNDQRKKEEFSKFEERYLKNNYDAEIGNKSSSKFEPPYKKSEYPYGRREEKFDGRKKEEPAFAAPSAVRFPDPYYNASKFEPPYNQNKNPYGRREEFDSGRKEESASGLYLKNNYDAEIGNKSSSKFEPPYKKSEYPYGRREEKFDGRKKEEPGFAAPSAVLFSDNASKLDDRSTVSVSNPYAKEHIEEIPQDSRISFKLSASQIRKDFDGHGFVLPSGIEGLTEEELLLFMKGKILEQKMKTSKIKGNSFIAYDEKKNGTPTPPDSIIVEKEKIQPKEVSTLDPNFAFMPLDEKFDHLLRYASFNRLNKAYVTLLLMPFYEEFVPPKDKKWVNDCMEDAHRIFIQELTALTPEEKDKIKIPKNTEEETFYRTLKLTINQGKISGNLEKEPHLISNMLKKILDFTPGGER